MTTEPNLGNIIEALATLAELTGVWIGLRRGVDTIWSSAAHAPPHSSPEVLESDVTEYPFRVEIRSDVPEGHRVRKCVQPILDELGRGWGVRLAQVRPEPASDPWNVEALSPALPASTILREASEAVREALSKELAGDVAVTLHSLTDERREPRVYEDAAPEAEVLRHALGGAYESYYAVTLNLDGHMVQGRPLMLVCGRRSAPDADGARILNPLRDSITNRIVPGLTRALEAWAYKRRHYLDKRIATAFPADKRPRASAFADVATAVCAAFGLPRARIFTLERYNTWLEERGTHGEIPSLSAKSWIKAARLRMASRSAVDAKDPSGSAGAQACHGLIPIPIQLSDPQVPDSDKHLVPVGVLVVEAPPEAGLGWYDLLMIERMMQTFARRLWWERREAGRADQRKACNDLLTHPLHEIDELLKSTVVNTLKVREACLVDLDRGADPLRWTAHTKEVRKKVSPDEAEVHLAVHAALRQREDDDVARFSFAWDEHVWNPRLSRYELKPRSFAFLAVRHGGAHRNSWLVVRVLRCNEWERSVDPFSSGDEHLLHFLASLHAALLRSSSEVDSPTSVRVRLQEFGGDYDLLYQDEDAKRLSMFTTGEEGTQKLTNGWRHALDSALKKRAFRGLITTPDGMGRYVVDAHHWQSYIDIRMFPIEVLLGLARMDTSIEALHTFAALAGEAVDQLPSALTWLSGRPDWVRRMAAVLAATHSDDRVTQAMVPTCRQLLGTACLQADVASMAAAFSTNQVFYTEMKALPQAERARALTVLRIGGRLGWTSRSAATGARSLGGQPPAFPAVLVTTAAFERVSVGGYYAALPRHESGRQQAGYVLTARDDSPTDGSTAITRAMEGPVDVPVQGEARAELVPVGPYMAPEWRRVAPLSDTIFVHLRDAAGVKNILESVSTRPVPPVLLVAAEAPLFRRRLSIELEWSWDGEPDDPWRPDIEEVHPQQVEARREIYAALGRPSIVCGFDAEIHDAGIWWHLTRAPGPVDHAAGLGVGALRASPVSAVAAAIPALNNHLATACLRAARTTQHPHIAQIAYRCHAVLRRGGKDAETLEGALVQAVGAR